MHFKVFWAIQKNKKKEKKICANQGSEFYNTYFKKWLKDSNIEMYSTHNEGKSVVAERFTRTLQNKHMTDHSKMYISMR